MRHDSHDAHGRGVAEGPVPVTEGTVVVPDLGLNGGDCDGAVSGVEQYRTAVAVHFGQRVAGYERRGGEAKEHRQHRKAAHEIRGSRHILILGVRRRKRQGARRLA